MSAWNDCTVCTEKEALIPLDFISTSIRLQCSSCGMDHITGANLMSYDAIEEMLEIIGLDIHSSNH